MKYLIVTIEYFTKWVEAKLVAQITAHKATLCVEEHCVPFLGF